MVKEITPAVVKAITRNLREFGYDVNEATVAEQIEKVKVGAQGPDQLTIIGMFARSMLVENGFIEEAQS